MNAAWSGLVLALGFFSLVAQALLFRVFLATVEGHEIGIGAFFGAWLLWVAAGAVLGRWATRRRGWSTAAVASWALLYLPAFALQRLLLFHARDLAGVAVYEIFPLDALIGVSLLACAPTSLATGFLFTLACQSRARPLPVARVYVLECLGAFAGGVAVTVLLALRCPWTTPLLAASLLLAVAASRCHLAASRSRWLGAGVVVALLAALGLGADRSWREAERRATWERTLGGVPYGGAFVTPQAEYLYGVREGQFLVLGWGGVVEALPGEEEGAEAAALHLAQHPEARRVLVMGPGSLPLCTALGRLASVERVTWLHPDPEYATALWAVLPEEHREAARTVERPAEDARAFLEEAAASGPPYDLVILNLPDVTTLVLNRYATREFLARARAAMAPDGVLSLRISGGANYLSGETAWLGACAFETLSSVFSRRVVVPGETSWLLGSDGRDLSGDAGRIRAGLAAVEGAGDLYPAEAVALRYSPPRAREQMRRYEEIRERETEALLANTERHPKALLYSLATTLRRSGRGGVAEDLPAWMEWGLWIAVGAILLYGLLRVLYLVRTPPPLHVPRREPAFDAGFLVFSTGLASMGLGVVLMFLYQGRFGSLYLDVGLVAALFMLGLFLGARAAEHLLARAGGEPRGVLHAFLLADLAAVALVALLPTDLGRLPFALGFALAGAAGGLFFPLAALRLEQGGRSPAEAGATLESVDHLGGAVGAVLAALFLLPLLGTQKTLLALGALVAVNALPALVPRSRRRAVAALPATERRLRPLGYVLLAAAASALVASEALASSRRDRRESGLAAAARAMAGEDSVTPREATLADGATTRYFALGDESGAVTGYVFETGPLAPDAIGYAGRLDLAVHVDGEGRLQGVSVLASRETPAYLALLDPWWDDLVGRGIRLFEPDPFAGVDTVSGATVTSDAVLRALRRAGPRFAREALGLDVEEAKGPARASGPDRDFLLLAALLLGALLLRHVPRPGLRRVWLAGVLALFGFWLNLQYSSHQVVSLLRGEVPVLLGGAFFLLLVMPVAVLLFGNVYCGWLCPFGAAQELVGDLRPRRWQTDPHRDVWRWGRALKYGLLALLLLAVALSLRREVVSADPLVTFFRLDPQDARRAFLLALGVLLLSYPFGRFWCRNLCPAGAFLALLNRVQALRRLLPSPRIGRCDLGVRSHHELDCICCDRCRHGP